MKKSTRYLLYIFILCLYPLTVFSTVDIPISGVTEPIHDLTLTLPVSGSVSAIKYKEGASVKKGDILLKLDNTLEKLEVERRKIIWKSKAEITSARARVKTLSNRLNASRELFKTTGSISLEELEKQELEYKIALAERQRLESTEKKEKIEYEMALEQLNKKILRSPIDGILTKFYLDIGETSTPEEPVVHLVDVKQFILVCSVESNIGAGVTLGQPVEIQINTGTEVITKNGKITYISPIVDPASGLRTIKALFENTDGKIQPGVSGSIRHL